MTFIDKLRRVQRKNKSLLCIGLDTDPAKLPRHLGRSRGAVLHFNQSIIEATSDLACAYKLNLAFYEALGERGWAVIRETLAAIPRNVITIGDGKRGDIGNTAEQYAHALFDELQFDSATVNPYMGYDSVEPFIRSDKRCAFVLALTSNEGSNDFQRLIFRGRPLYEKVVQAAMKWNTKNNIGLVVGATHPTELEPIRILSPSVPILIPGIGKQGGDLESAVRFGCDADGELAIINASRSILFASSGKDFAAAARNEALRLRSQIQNYRKQFFS
ncbi:MAG TPA: orotidine-5'-phosphate decarboxylase [Bacteroidetes bacterium]|nr:orotidine-5'-phosphate decarboxylase [Bacteroidota bacterium]